uniref:Protein kinase domain-containing protein n=1 Tax=Palpitomonas bilix TaxID=652834 RepID=A0A7S3LXE7_9EUKA|mmetsp:Transcript_8214/g.21810  ORF Transcript_8214/g.21810 Transcript_8214/m.21810 type:complete len:846 (+) Transcript_8214:169-2706(+)
MAGLPEDTAVVDTLAIGNSGSIKDLPIKWREVGICQESGSFTPSGTRKTKAKRKKTLISPAAENFIKSSSNSVQSVQLSWPDEEFPLEAPTIRYFEITIMSLSSTGGALSVGVTSPNCFSEREYVGQYAGSYGVDAHTGEMRTSATDRTRINRGFSRGDVLGFGLDLEEQTIIITKNAKRLGGFETSIQDQDIFALSPTISISGSGAVVAVNVGHLPFLAVGSGDIEPSALAKLIQPAQAQGAFEADDMQCYTRLKSIVGCKWASVMKGRLSIRSSKQEAGTTTAAGSQATTVQSTKPMMPYHLVSYFEVGIVKMSDGTMAAKERPGTASVGALRGEVWIGISSDGKSSKGLGHSGQAGSYAISSRGQFVYISVDGDETLMKSESFGSAMTVGCGINYITEEVFFTIDGHMVKLEYDGQPRNSEEDPMLAQRKEMRFRLPDGNRVFYPSVTLHRSSSEVVLAANFGRMPFKFRVRDLIEKNSLQLSHERVTTPEVAQVEHDAKGSLSSEIVTPIESLSRVEREVERQENDEADLSDEYSDDFEDFSDEEGTIKETGLKVELLKAELQKKIGVEERPSIPSEWVKGELLGRGGFGSVYKVRDESDPTRIFALKEVSMSSSDAESVDEVEAEIRALEKVHHPRVVEYFGCCRRSGKLFIFMEYLGGGALDRFVRLSNGLSISLAKEVCRQILEGIAYLHDRGIVHRDIKSSNVLVDKECPISVKLADFGAAAQMQQMKTMTGEIQGVIGTATHLAPEVLQEAGYGRKADIWSFGCLLVEVLTGKPPWPNFKNPFAIIYHVAHKGASPEIPSQLDEIGADFCQQCFARNPDLRPSAKKLLQHPFLAIR